MFSVRGFLRGYWDRTRSEASETEAVGLARERWAFPWDEGLASRARTARVEETPEAEGDAGVVGAGVSPLAFVAMVEVLLARLDGVDGGSSSFCLYCGLISESKSSGAGAGRPANMQGAKAAMRLRQAAPPTRPSSVACGDGQLPRPEGRRSPWREEAAPTVPKMPPSHSNRAGGAYPASGGFCDRL